MQLFHTNFFRVFFRDIEPGKLLRRDLSICTFVLFISSMMCFGQNGTTSIVFEPQIGGEHLVQFRKYYFKANDDSISVDVFRFYVSQVEFLEKNKVVARIEDGYFLIDLFDSTACSVTTPAIKAKYDRIRFNLGIDSSTNVAGVMGGALDPTHGMYWAWQSGYINMKLEGISNRCTERNHRYQFHLGGYFFPFNALRKVEVPVDGTRPIRIAVDVQSFLGETDLAVLSHVMSPCEKAVSLSAKAAKMFMSIQ